MSKTTARMEREITLALNNPSFQFLSVIVFSEWPKESWGTQRLDSGAAVTFLGGLERLVQYPAHFKKNIFLDNAWQPLENKKRQPENVIAQSFETLNIRRTSAHFVIKLALEKLLSN